MVFQKPEPPSPISLFLGDALWVQAHFPVTVLSRGGRSIFSTCLLSLFTPDQFKLELLLCSLTCNTDGAHSHPALSIAGALHDNLSLSQ